MKHSNTKEKLIQAAIKSFANHGFTGASTRMITGEINANISAIPYYFKNKEGLYQAVIIQIFGKMHDILFPHITKVQQLCHAENTSHEAYQEAFDTLISAYAHGMIIELSHEAISIFLREQADPSPFFNDYYKNTITPFHESLTHLIAKLINVDLHSEEMVIIMHTLLGQITIFRSHKTMFLRRIGWREYNKKNAQKIINIILNQSKQLINTYRTKGL